MYAKPWWSGANEIIGIRIILCEVIMMDQWERYLQFALWSDISLPTWQNWGKLQVKLEFSIQNWGKLQVKLEFYQVGKTARKKKFLSKQTRVHSHTNIKQIIMFDMEWPISNPVF